MAAIFNAGAGWVAGVTAAATISVIAGGLFILRANGTLGPGGGTASPRAAPTAVPAPSAGPLAPPPQAEAQKPAAGHAEPPQATPAPVTPAPPQTAIKAPPTPAAGPGQDEAATAVFAPVATSPLAAAFDIVRVEPSGDSVIAGRAAAGVRVALLDHGQEIAATVTDATGQFVFLPASFEPGSHVLQLQVTAAGVTNVSPQSVTVAVPPSGKGRVTITLATPDKAPADLAGAAAAPGPAPPQPNTVAAPQPAPGSRPAISEEIATGSVVRERPAVTISAIEISAAGGLTAAGTAVPGSQVRLYLNGSFVVTVTADAGGRWSLRVEKGMTPGPYDLRAEDLIPATGDVLSRADLAFSYIAAAAAPVPPATAAAATPPPHVDAMPPAAATQPTPTVPAAAGSVPKANAAATAEAALEAGPGGTAPQAPPATTPTSAPEAAVPSSTPGIASRTGDVGTAEPGKAAPAVAAVAALATSGKPSETPQPPAAQTSAPNPAATAGDGPPQAAPPIVARAQSPVTARPASPADAPVRPTSGPQPALRAAPQVASSGPGPFGHFLQSADAVIAEIRTELVRPGNSLGSISRSQYGEGVRFVEILQANARPIRDPRTIYPGQIVVVPNKRPTN